MKTIEVKSCGECPFMFKGNVFELCRIDDTIIQSYLPRESVHENCPLKNESITVKLKSDEN